MEPTSWNVKICTAGHIVEPRPGAWSCWCSHLLSKDSFTVVRRPPVPNDDRVGKSRRDHGDTAKRAAIEVAPRTGTQRERVLRYIATSREAGIDRDRIAQALRLSPNTVRPRVKELIDGGFVCVVEGRVALSATGRDAELLTLTDKGFEAVGFGY